MPIHKKLSHFLRRRTPLIFAAWIAVIILINIGTLTNKMFTSWPRLRNPRWAYYPGYEILGLKDLFQLTDRVGYYTDFDPLSRQGLGRFTRAAYALSPIILDSQIDDKEYVIFDCQNPPACLAKMRLLDFQLLKINNFGIILGKKKK